MYQDIVTWSDGGKKKMKNRDYELALNNTPKFTALFEVVRVPDWTVRHGVKKR